MAFPRTKDDIDALKPEGPELELLEKCRLGEPCVLGWDRPEGPSPERTIRAEILRYVILGGCAAHPGTERGVMLVGAHIAGTLDLDWATAQGPVHLDLCDFAQAVRASGATLPALSLNGSRVPSLNAHRARINGGVFLRAQEHVPFRASGEVSLSGARIGGQLACEGGVFENAAGFALNAQGAEIAGGVFLRAQGDVPFRASGEVSLPGARVGGQLACEGGVFEKSPGFALNAQGAEITGDVFLRAQGEAPFRAAGEVRLSGARIGGQLACEGGVFENASGLALNAEGAEITRDVFLQAQGELPFRASGEVRLRGARIGGQLTCGGGMFENAPRFALNAQEAEITGGVFLQAQGELPFRASGEVSLSGARIGGQLSCVGGVFENGAGFALNVDGAEITGEVLLRAQGELPFRASGEVRLQGARIGGQLACVGGVFKNGGGFALNAQKARIEDGLLWRKVRAGAGAYNLNSAHASVLFDDLACWPDIGLDLDGFSYDRIVGETDAASRLEWLARGTRDNGAFYPQPYGQLARVLREMGHGQEAREILYERERLIRRETRARGRIVPNGDVSVGLHSIWVDLIHLPRDLWHALEKWVVGYGLKPGRSAWAFLLLWAACFVLTLAAWRAGEMAPNAGPLLSQAEWQRAFETEDPPGTWAATPVGTSWEKFSAGAYAFDVVVPLIEIGQVSAWGPLVEDAEGTGWGRALWIASWVFSVGGWIVALLATAGLTGALSSRKD